MEILERRIVYSSMILFLFSCFSSCSSKEQQAQKHFKKGFEYHNLGALDKAVEEYRVALELNPRFVEVYMNLGAIYVDKKDYDQAIQQFKKVVELNYYNTKGHYNLGMVYVYRGDKEKAETELKILKSFGSGLADNLEKRIIE